MLGDVGSDVEEGTLLAGRVEGRLTLTLTLTLTLNLTLTLTPTLTPTLAWLVGLKVSCLKEGSKSITAPSSHLAR